MKAPISCVASSIVVFPMLIALPAQATEIHCPAAISESPTVSFKDRQWSIVAKPGERQLDHAGVYLSAAGEYGAEVPDSTKAAKRSEERVLWRMADSPTEAFAIGCSYTGTTAMLFMKLEKSVAQCVVTYELLPTGTRQRLRSIECR